MKTNFKNIMRGIAMSAALLLLCASISCAPSTAYGNAVEDATHREAPDSPIPSTFSGLTEEELYKIEELKQKEELAFSTYEAQAEDSFEYDEIDGGVKITKYVGKDTVVVVPSSLGGKSVYAIGEKAFSGSAIRALYLPETVKTVESGALVGCDNLSTLKMPMINIPDGGSLGCLFGSENHLENSSKVSDKLTMVILTSGEGELPEKYFYGFEGLEMAALPDSITSIGDFAFYGCKSLIYTNLQHTERIGEYAFGECRSLYRVYMESAREIGLGAFYRCDKIRVMYLPIIGGGSEDNAYLGYIFGAASVDWNGDFVPERLGCVVVLGGERIGDKAFYKCSSIVEVHLPNTLESIGIRSFYGCVSIREIEIPESVTVIGDDAFFGCSSLEKVNMSGSTSVGMQAFYGTKYEHDSSK